MADVSDSVRTSLDRADLKDVKVTEDHDKGVVTLTGHVAADAGKSNAAAIAQAIAPAQVVSNQLAVITPGEEGDSKVVNSDLDNGIEHNPTP